MKKKFAAFMFGSSFEATNTANLAMLLLRVHIGLSLAIQAGLPKMQEGLAPDWFVKQVGEIGFTFISPTFWATIASWGEFIGGLCLALGLLTRFSALQLAFQFFVISFIWYDKPEPIVGMYFQQTLFWGYVLFAFVGGGKFSLDYLIVAKRKSNAQLLPKVALVSCLLMFSLASCAQNGPLNGSGVIVTKIYEFSNFTKVNIKDVPGKITIEVGKPFAIQAATDDNFEKILSITEANGELKLQFIGNNNNRMYIEETNVDIKISMPSLTEIKHSANSALLVFGIKAKSLKVKNNENGKVNLKGSVEELSIVCAGNGNVDANELAASKVNVTTRGNGNVYINTNNEFEAAASGNGSIYNAGLGITTSKSSIMGNGSVKYTNRDNKKHFVPNDSVETTKVKVRFDNTTTNRINFKVVYPIKGSYGITLEPEKISDYTFPVGTKIYKRGSKKVFYEVANKVDEIIKL